MTFDQIIVNTMAISMVIGAIDAMIGNRFGLGEQFEKGFETMGSLALGMVGMIVLAPVLSDVLAPVVIPVFEFFGADPAMFGGLLAIDMGGYPLAEALGQSQEAIDYAGIIVASMFGCTLVFSLPLAFKLIEKDQQEDFAVGLIAGLITIPIGAMVGGLFAGYSFEMVWRNTLPIIILSIILIVGFLYFRSILIRLTILFANLLNALIYFGLAVGALEYLTGFSLIENTAPITDGTDIVVSIAITMLGAYPFVTILTQLLKKPLTWLGEKIGISTESTSGFLITLANSVPVYDLSKKMDQRGRIMNYAFIIPATSVLGAHLGYTTSVASHMVGPMMIAKLVGGLLAIILANWFARVQINE